MAVEMRFEEDEKDLVLLSLSLSDVEQSVTY